MKIATLILSLIFLIGCGGDANRIVPTEFKNGSGVSHTSLYDTKLEMYCIESDKAGLDLKPTRCIPYFGDVYYVDQSCKKALIGFAMPINQENPRYITSDNRFYYLSEGRTIIYTVKPYHKDVMGNCTVTTMNDMDMFKDIMREVRYDEFGEK